MTTDRDTTQTAVIRDGDDRVDAGQALADSGESLWIFGYGSLVWRPAFAHLCRRPASIEGYARRFWQGSTDHRGLPDRPGRVVTLIDDDHPSLLREAGYSATQCWGTAYQVPSNDPDGVLAGLDYRERGGYGRVELDLQLAATNDASAQHVAGLVYIATPDNDNYLGAASLEAIALQIAGAKGPSGANPEYVFELARSLREMDATDEHVFAVEAAVRARLDVPAESVSS